MKLLLITLIISFFYFTHEFAIHGKGDTVFGTRCKGYESTQKYTSTKYGTSYFIIDYSFSNESFMASVTNFTSGYYNLALTSFSYDTGREECDVTLDDPMPALCTFNISTTNSYDLSFQLDYMSFPTSFLTIITSKTFVVTHPDVSPQRPCQGSGSKDKIQIDFCCLT